MKTPLPVPVRALVAVAVAPFVVAALVAGCQGGTSISDSGGGAVYYWHDDVHSVSCWTAWSQSITCLPDAQVKNAGG